ncbi:MAG: nucleotidyltransferase domain-containing protein [Betaproteobacteria bacterium]|nr:nucleotidyltransferase domain-containing protein [Betaproteobacteria bacterium]
MNRPSAPLSSSAFRRSTSSSTGAGQLQLKKLLDAGVVIDERLGNQRRIRANTRFPLYPELRSICLKSFGFGEKLRAALKPLATGITAAFLFGSVAKGTDRYDSDIDLMVVGTVGLIELNEILASLEQELGRKIHLSLYSPDDWQAAKQDAVVARILSEPIVKVLPDDEPTS